VCLPWLGLTRTTRTDTQVCPYFQSPRSFSEPSYHQANQALLLTKLGKSCTYPSREDPALRHYLHLIWRSGWAGTKSSTLSNERCFPQRLESDAAGFWDHLRRSPARELVFAFSRRRRHQRWV